MNQASMDRQVLGEAVARAVGERAVRALVLTTHDLDPQFLEQEIFPAFLGIQAVHSPRIRVLQVGTEIRDRGIDIDVFFESRALAAEEGSAYLGWNRVPMKGKHGGKFHPKVAIAVCRDEVRGEDVLVVVTGSANLNRGGWWTNVECIDVAQLAPRVKHSYAFPLAEFVDRLWAQRGKIAPGSETPALRVVRDALRTVDGYSQVTSNGVLRSAFLPGYGQFSDDLAVLLGNRLRGANLEVISPFLDEHPDSVVAVLTALYERFDLKAVRLSLPVRAERTTISEDLYDAVVALPFVEWAALPTTYTRSSASGESLPRSVHAKVYRFWRSASAHGGAIDVRVMGSHNLTTAAHSGNLNWEASVVHELVKPQGVWFLETGITKPACFEEPDPDAERELAGSVVPATVRFDWQTRSASLVWGPQPPPPDVLLSQNGREILRARFTGERAIDLSSQASATLHDALLRSCVLRAEWKGEHWGYFLVQELNHHLKPDPLTYLELTAAEILALWSIPELRDRIERLGRVRDRAAPWGEDLDDTVAAPPSSMFDRFAGVFHAFASLRRTIAAHTDEGEERKAAAAMYAAHLGSPINLLRVVRSDVDREGGSDLELAYVTYSSARLLDAWAAKAYPGLAKSNAALRKDLKKELTFMKPLRALMLARSADRPEMADFLDWFDAEFRREVASA